MINSVSGELYGKQLGITLMHEHITWDRSGANSIHEHDVEEVVNTMLPYLLDLKHAGCDTFVDATTCGSGRNMEVLVECSRRSGLNILTNVGAWDGGDHNGKFIPDFLKEKSIDEIAEIWTSDFHNGMEGTAIKPSYIKVALGDTGQITELQEKFLRAASRTSILTRMPIQCHTIPAKSALRAVEIVTEESLSLNKFIWVHGDVERNFEAIIALLRKGAWVEFDYLGRCDAFKWYIEAFKALNNEGLLKKLLISQDAGTYYFGEENKSFIPYDSIFKKFIPYCIENGISKDIFHKLLVVNPQIVLDIEL